MWWAITWPVLAALWAFLFVFLGCCIIGYKAHVAWRCGTRWVSRLALGFGGLITVAFLPMGLEWGNLSLRGVPVRAKVVNTRVEYDSDLERTVTHITYQFEAEASGQPQPFRREAGLPGRYTLVSGFINVLYDPATPAHSRMTREFRGLQDSLATAAVLLAIGVTIRLLSRPPIQGRPKPSEATA